MASATCYWWTKVIVILTAQSSLIVYSVPNCSWSFCLNCFEVIYSPPGTHVPQGYSSWVCLCVSGTESAKKTYGLPQRCNRLIYDTFFFCKVTVFEWQLYWRNCRPFCLLSQALDCISIHIALDHLVLLLWALPLCLVRRYIAHVRFIITGRWPRPCAFVRKVCPQSSFLRWWFSTLVPSSVMNCFRTVCPFRLNGWDVCTTEKVIPFCFVKMEQ